MKLKTYHNSYDYLIENISQEIDTVILENLNLLRWQNLNLTVRTTS